MTAEVDGVGGGDVRQMVDSAALRVLVSHDAPSHRMITKCTVAYSDVR